MFKVTRATVPSALKHGFVLGCLMTAATALEMGEAITCPTGFYLQDYECLRKFLHYV
jgi:hypothetical protein